jgi:hypothetical protein
MFGQLGRALRLYRLYCQCEAALKAGAGKPTMSKTKLGAVIAAVGAICVIAAKAINGEMTWIMALPEILTIVGTVVAVFGGRDAIAKIGQ